VTFRDLQTLLDFHYWARDRVLDAAEALTPEQYTQDMGSSFKSVRDTLVHILSSEWAWHQRWMGMSVTAMLSAEQYPDVASLRAAWREQEGKTRAFLDGVGADNIDRVFAYTTLAGQAMQSTFWQMLQHLVNHGSYHRGQITTMLRQLGAQPAKSVDLITFYRSRDRKPETRC
jgi:uncharacterized damage-inducible protein DinB